MKCDFRNTDQRLAFAERMLISDIDNTLLGNRSALDQLMRRLETHRGVAGFGVATGRYLESALDVLNEWSVPTPDVMITSVGTEIYYGSDFVSDEGWARHIDHRWEPEELRKLMDELPGLEPQPDTRQREFKLSYQLVDPKAAPKPAEIRHRLSGAGLRAKLIFSHQKYVDLLPIRACKGFALRYFAEKWGIPLAQVLVAGDSGNDVDMIRGSSLAIVVGNHHSELKTLKKLERIYFAEGYYARGILEGIDHYDFFGRCDVNMG